jgi:hypothetical protein
LFAGRLPSEKEEGEMKENIASVARSNKEFKAVFDVTDGERLLFPLYIIYLEK